MSAEVHNHCRNKLVLNGRSGNGCKGVEELVMRYWPGPISVLGLSEINARPDLLKDTNLIVWAGDGTITGLGNLMRINNPEGWIYPLAGGTLGDIAECLGNAKLPKEKNPDYIERMAQRYAQGMLAVREIEPGYIGYNGVKKPLEWTGGAGKVVKNVLARMEHARDMRWARLPRLAYSLLGVINDLKKGKDLKAYITGGYGSLNVMEADIIHWPFHRFGSMTLGQTDGDDQLWLVHRPESYEAVWETAIRLALDALRMKMKWKHPRAGAVEVLRLPKYSSVRLEGEMHGVQKDSEIYQAHTKEVVLYSAQNTGDKPYRVLVSK